LPNGPGFLCGNPNSSADGPRTDFAEFLGDIPIEEATFAMVGIRGSD
jgi:hypothetical protein